MIRAVPVAVSKLNSFLGEATTDAQPVVKPQTSTNIEHMSTSRHSEHNVYVRNLSEKRKGYPLYHPAPSDDLPLEYRCEGVELGDVGRMTVAGVFDPFFNIFKSSSHPINAYGGVPYGFQPLSLTPASCLSHANWHPKNTQYSNEALKSRKLSSNAGADAPGLPLGAQFGFSYESSSSEGACLVLPDGGNCIDLRALDPIAQYAERNAGAWFNYAAQRGIAVEDLYLVTGVDKARSWAMATYSYSSSKTSVEFQFTACTLANAGASVEYSWRHNPDQPLSTKVCEPNERPNQAIFLRGFSISCRRSRRPFKARVRVELLEGCDEGYYFPIAKRGILDRSPALSTLPAPPASALTPYSSLSLEQPFFSSSDEYSDDSSNSSMSDLELPETMAHVYPPGQILNHYLLRRSNDDVHFAITHDLDWCDLQIEIATELFSGDHSVVDAALNSAVESCFDVISDRGIVSLKARPPRTVDNDATQGALISFSDVAVPSHQRSPEGIPNDNTSSLSHIINSLLSTTNPSWTEPSWHGWIETTGDALLILEAARRGLIPRVTRQLYDSERKMITSGSVFVFDENESGIKRWTDDLFWSPSRVLGNFLLYREIDKRAPSRHGGTKSDASEQQDQIDYNNSDGHVLSRPRTDSDSEGRLDRQRERHLVGSLTNSYNFKSDGLMKKTFSLNINGVAQHLISYYKIEDVEIGLLCSPTSVPGLASLDISPEYLDKTHFRNPPKVEIIDGFPKYRGEADQQQSADPSNKRGRRHEPYPSSPSASKRPRRAKGTDAATSSTGPSEPPSSSYIQAHPSHHSSRPGIIAPLPEDELAEPSVVRRMVHEPYTPFPSVAKDCRVKWQQ